MAYDGAGFAGWARQPGQRTVQGELERAIGVVLRTPAPTLTVGARTDAGVHAAGQVAHVDIASPVTARRLNGVLPPDVRVRSVTPAAAGFDARFSALWRSYRYRVTDGVPDPLRRHETLAHPRPLGVPAMQSAARRLVGEHDFAAYCRQRSGATTIRTLLRLDVGRSGDLVTLDAEADAFCHSMVRALTGALLAVGDGRRPDGWPAAVLAGGVRDPAVVVAAPHGLTLTAVCYPPDEELALRASATRRVRIATNGSPSPPQT